LLKPRRYLQNGHDVSENMFTAISLCVKFMKTLISVGTLKYDVRAHYMRTIVDRYVTQMDTCDF